MSDVLQGLEFDDVFLLDFFADSPATAEWRVLLSYLEELSLDETAAGDKKVDFSSVFQFRLILCIFQAHGSCAARLIC